MSYQDTSTTEEAECELEFIRLLSGQLWYLASIRIHYYVLPRPPYDEKYEATSYPYKPRHASYIATLWLHAFR
jgi:hypothetical protein